MVKLTEVVYLAAPFSRPEERAFNEQVCELMRAYNFPVFMPQEALEECQGEEWLELCMERLTHANLVVAVFYGEEFDPPTGFEVGYALGRRHNVVAIQHNHNPSLLRSAVEARMATPQLCNRVIMMPGDPERFTDRLIPVLNRFFVPHLPP